MGAGQENTLNLLVTLDRRYLDPLKTMLESYASMHKEEFTRVYVAHRSLTEEDLSLLRECFLSEQGEVVSITIGASWFRNTPVLERLPEESFYRVMAFSYLPKEVERVLYLDPDILVRRSLTELYRLDLRGCCIAAASHTYGQKDRINRTRLGLHQRYINSGVMLMDLAAIRKKYTVSSVLKTMEDNLQKLLMGDQDLANLLFDESIHLLDERIYNLDERTFRHNRRAFPIARVEAETAIIHYNGKYKPWLEDYKGVLDGFYPPTDKTGAPSKKLATQAMAIRRIVRPNLRQKIVLGCMIAVVLLSAVCYVLFGSRLMELVSHPEALREAFDGFGIFDELFFVLIRAAQTVVKFIPAEPLEIGSGYLWGVWGGTVFCLLGNLLGTCVIWALTKRFGRKFAEMFLPQRMAGGLTKQRDPKVIYVLLFFFYLIPGSPKDGLTYIAALLPIRFVPFMAITGIARIPSVVSSTLCGATLARQEYFLAGAIFAATILLAAGGGLWYKSYTKRQKQQNLS